MLADGQDEHFDGEREGVYNDSIGKEIGVQSDAAKESANPFHVKALKKENEMGRMNRTRK
ncbi:MULTISPECIES: hypothetical protein [Sediminibacillus]|uniref:hypothetical protein n=1 Tax=Sediminibacillus TaxID=482460 RepID=UPI001295DE19|nr:hypothetical protein [Sediminibacillus terrae]